MTTTTTTRPLAGFLVRAVIATLAALGLVFGGVTAANAVPGGTLVAGGPTLTSSKYVNVAAGDVLTISGSGYNSTTAEGVYVSFGWVNASAGWRPSAGASAANRVTKQTVWVRPGTVPAGVTDQVNWTTTGASNATFSFTLPVQAPDTNPNSNAVFYIYSVNGHGVANASNEQGREVSFSGTTTTPSTSGGQGVVQTAFKNPTTGVVTVTGTGYTGTPATGIYVSIGTLDNAGWKPSAGYASTTRVATDTVWTYGAGPASQSGGTAKLNADGSFSVTLNGSALPTPAAGKHIAAYTVGAHGIVRALSEAEKAIS